MCSLLFPAGKHPLLCPSLLFAERPMSVVGEGNISEMQNEEWALQARCLMCIRMERGEVLKFIPKDTEVLKERSEFSPNESCEMLGITFPEDFLKSKKKTQGVSLPWSLLPTLHTAPVSMELMIKSSKQICLWELPKERLGPRGWRLYPLDSMGSWLKQVSSPQCYVYERRACSSMHWGLYLSASAPSHKHTVRSNNG